jgi:hypothetical protein
VAPLGREQLRGKAGLPSCANRRERAVTRRATWYCLAGFGCCKERQFRHGFLRKGARSARSAPRKLLQKNKNGSGAAIEFCGYRKVVEANPTDLPLQNFYGRKILSICDRICSNLNIPLYCFSQLIPTLALVVEGGGKEGRLKLSSIATSARSRFAARR